MSEHREHKSDVATGFFAGLIVLLLFGFFLGLPVVVWFLLIAAFVGLWVATADRRKAERTEAKVPTQRRPWHKE
jgi:predicted lipid-binding transport protein (Tim44 family)